MERGLPGQTPCSASRGARLAGDFLREQQILIPIRSLGTHLAPWGQFCLIGGRQAYGVGYLEGEEYTGEEGKGLLVAQVEAGRLLDTTNSLEMNQFLIFGTSNSILLSFVP